MKEPCSRTHWTGCPPISVARSHAIELEKAKADLAKCLKILDGGLEGKSFLLGDYSLADTHLQGFVGWISSMDVDLTPFPKVTGWLQRCSERPAIANLMAG
ncbi:glutathione S-transferase family protein [Leptolyngbyaceae cyanobacterium UHCC 1019]